MSAPEVTASAIDCDWAFARYEAIRPHLVEARFPAASNAVANIDAVADRFDAFVLDAFGVLNVGETAIPGAVDRIRRLRQLGKRLVVLTNSATQSRRDALAKHRRLGFDFTLDEVVASRDLAATALRQAKKPAGPWAAASGPEPDFGDLDGLEVRDLLAEPSLYARAAGFVLFSSAGWTETHQVRLAEALTERPRPLVIANPDLVAPRETGFTLEPGHYAHRLREHVGAAMAFYGKPFPSAFDEAVARVGEDVPRSRIAMVGDTLHTDILGGRAAGLATVLVTDHGLFAGRDVRPFIDRSGIVPDVVISAL